MTSTLAADRRRAQGEQLRAHGCGQRGGPATPARGEPLEHAALDQHLLAAALKEIDLVLAQLDDPFSQRRQCGVTKNAPITSID